MNRGTRDLLFITAGLLLSAVTLWAGTGDDARLRKDVAYLNAVGSEPQGARNLERSLVSAFKTHAAWIVKLRKDRLGAGDIAAAFAVASRLAGGISDANLRRVVALWREQRSAGWAAIAKSLGVRVRGVVLKVESVGNQRAAAAAAPAGASQPITVGPRDTLRGLLHHG